jgi:hypothetical protein
MRSSLLASVAVTATLTTAFAPSIADACGGYMPDPRPAVFAVDDHNVHREGTDRWDRRAFVVLGATTAPADATWKQLAPRTFDGTQLADVPDPDQSTTFTLIGPSGTQVVSSNRLAVLKQTFGNRVEHSAMEVGIDQQSQFRIAVLGVQPDTKWIETTAGTPTRNTLTWVRKQGMDTEYVYIAKIKGTSIQVISAHGKNDIGLTSFVVVDGESRGTFVGSPIGGLDLGGKRYVLLEREGLITPIEV